MKRLPAELYISADVDHEGEAKGRVNARRRQRAQIISTAVCQFTRFDWYTQKFLNDRLRIPDYMIQK